MPARKRPSLGRRVTVFVVAAAALAVLIGAAIGDRGYLSVRRRTATYNEMQRKVGAVQADNAKLLAEITALKDDPYVVEKLARERLGLAKPGEVIYVFPPDVK